MTLRDKNTTNEIKNLSDRQIGREVYCINGKLIFSEKRFFAKKIYCIDQNTGQEEWVLDVSNIGEKSGSSQNERQTISAFMGCSKEGLFVSTSNRILASLDLESGDCLWVRKSTNDRIKIYGDRLVNVDATHYCEISCRSGETKIEYQMSAEYARHGFRFMGTNSNFTVTKKYVFIVDAMGFMLGCINRDTGSIDWSTEVGNGKVTLPHAPTLYGNHLYVLDDEGTLYVYKRYNHSS